MGSRRPRSPGRVGPKGPINYTEIPDPEVQTDKQSSELQDPHSSINAAFLERYARLPPQPEPEPEPLEDEDKEDEDKDNW